MTDETNESDELNAWSEGIASGQDVLAAARAAGANLGQQATTDQIAFAEQQAEQEAAKAKAAEEAQYREFLAVAPRQSPMSEQSAAALAELEELANAPDAPAEVDFETLPTDQFEQLVASAKSGSVDAFRDGLTRSELLATAARLMPGRDAGDEEAA